MSADLLWKIGDFVCVPHDRHDRVLIARRWYGNEEAELLARAIQSAVTMNRNAQNLARSAQKGN